MKNISSTGGAGGILDIFYEEWKLKLNEHEKVVNIMRSLYQSTYATCSNHFAHNYGQFNPEEVYMYIDRVCFRVPDRISDMFKMKNKSLQRSLTPHLDCCPTQMSVSTNAKSPYPKWRPIQAFIALTDTLHSDEGGFEACPELHKSFDTWTATRKSSVTKSGKVIPPPCVGDFTPIRPIEDKDIMDQFRHIPCKAGDMVCWDYRIPHANAQRNTTDVAREVVYIGILPGTAMNRIYAMRQLNMYREGDVPTDQWHECKEKQFCSYQFSELGQKMMTISTY